MKQRLVDIVIIGSVSAGLNAMAQARQVGRSFVLINGGTTGTTCARIGCMLRMPFYRPVIEGALKAALSQLHGKVDARNPGPIIELALAAG